MPTLKTSIPAVVLAQIAPADGLVANGQPCEGGELVIHQVGERSAPGDLIFYLDRLGRLVVDGPEADHYSLDEDGYLHYRPCLTAELTNPNPGATDGLYLTTSADDGGASVPYQGTTLVEVTFRDNAADPVPVPEVGGAAAFIVGPGVVSAEIADFTPTGFFVRVRGLTGSQGGSSIKVTFGELEVVFLVVIAAPVSLNNAAYFVITPSSAHVNEGQVAAVTISFYKADGSPAIGPLPSQIACTIVNPSKASVPANPTQVNGNTYQLLLTGIAGGSTVLNVSAPTPAGTSPFAGGYIPVNVGAPIIVSDPDSGVTIVAGEYRDFLITNQLGGVPQPIGNLYISGSFSATSTDPVEIDRTELGFTLRVFARAPGLNNSFLINRTDFQNVIPKLVNGIDVIAAAAPYIDVEPHHTTQVVGGDINLVASYRQADGTDIAVPLNDWSVTSSNPAVLSFTSLTQGVAQSELDELPVSILLHAEAPGLADITITAPGATPRVMTIRIRAVPIIVTPNPVNGTAGATGEAFVRFYDPLTGNPRPLADIDPDTLSIATNDPSIATVEEIIQVDPYELRVVLNFISPGGCALQAILGNYAEGSSPIYVSASGSGDFNSDFNDDFS